MPVFLAYAANPRCNLLGGVSDASRAAGGKHARVNTGKVNSESPGICDAIAGDGSASVERDGVAAVDRDWRLDARCCCQKRRE